MNKQCADNDDDDDEENEKEGSRVRMLFRTESDSSEDTKMMTPAEQTLQQEQQQFTTVVRKILNVELEESVVGGSIEHRLWPAAEYLASFILKIVKEGRSSPSASSPVASSASMADNYQASSLKDKKPTTSTKHTLSSAAQDSLVNLKRLLHKSSNTTAANSSISEQDSSNDDAALPILELGAGIGLTGLALAMQLSHLSILLTDLDSALSLLRSNVERNPNVQSPVQVSRLEWGNPKDLNHVLTTWYQPMKNHSNSNDDSASSSSSSSSRPPLLILGSDCVYWEHLYEPLERTIAGLLQAASPDSMCLLAGMRRWKRDNHFYRHGLGKATATKTGRLQCTCLDEQVVHNHETDPPQRQIMRIYAIQWIRTNR